MESLSMTSCHQRETMPSPLRAMANAPCCNLAWLVCFMLVLGCALGGPCQSGVMVDGYDCEEHTVTTQDGYILTMQRIPNGRSGSKGGNKIPVLLQHGVLVDGLVWLLNSPDESLGFILANSGFDVWINNGRGSTYSQGHTSIAPNDPAYWDWSWDALVDYELPAIFEYVYSQTGQQKIHYVGHSEGTLVALASFAEHKLLDMIRSAALLSPIAYLEHVSSPIVQAAAATFVGEAINWLGIHEFDPAGAPVKLLLQKICKSPGIDCSDLPTVITGKNCCLNSTTTQAFLKYEPQPTATMNMIQLAQMIRRGTITKYNYDNLSENMEHYGQPFPPSYDMSAIPNDLPLFLSYGGSDALSDVIDVEHLLDDLKSHDKHKLTVHYVSNYAHGDFVMAFNAKQVVYDPLIAFLKIQ